MTTLPYTDRHSNTETAKRHTPTTSWSQYYLQERYMTTSWPQGARTSSAPYELRGTKTTTKQNGSKSSSEPRSSK